MRKLSPHHTTAPDNTPREPAIGFVYALSAFGLWGLFPIYLKAVAHIPVWEVVAHRVVWSVPAGLIILVMIGKLDVLRAALRQPKLLANAALTATLISTNWGVYVYAVATNQAVDGALGYYINPLVNVVIGAVLLGERLNRLQSIAIALAVIAVTILTVHAGGLPWISLVLAFSFGFYGYFRKTMALGAAEGFSLEVILLSTVAMPVVVWLASTGQGAFVANGWWDSVLLFAGGPVTAIPLILYANGARLLRYTTIGVMQYLAPTMIFLIAVFVFGEPFGAVQLVAFCFIWAALAVYAASLFRNRKTG
ncbi:MAG: EamA family transporter RarD [Pseudomonadota bacterium]